MSHTAALLQSNAVILHSHRTRALSSLPAQNKSIFLFQGASIRNLAIRPARKSNLSVNAAAPVEAAKPVDPYQGEVRGEYIMLGMSFRPFHWLASAYIRSLSGSLWLHVLTSFSMTSKTRLLLSNCVSWNAITRRSVAHWISSSFRNQNGFPSSQKRRQWSALAWHLFRQIGSGSRKYNNSCSSRIMHFSVTIKSCWRGFLLYCSFMKLRLDRVLKLDLGKMAIDDATKSTAPLPEFKPPEKWSAPYSPYAYGWWEVFMRKWSGESTRQVSFTKHR